MDQCGACNSDTMLGGDGCGACSVRAVHDRSEAQSMDRTSVGETSAEARQSARRRLYEDTERELGSPLHRTPYRARSLAYLNTTVDPWSWEASQLDERLTRLCTTILAGNRTSWRSVSVTPTAWDSSGSTVMPLAYAVSSLEGAAAAETTPHPPEQRLALCAVCIGVAATFTPSTRRRIARALAPASAPWAK